ncbi:MAG: hypothetical protein ACTSXQ_04230 [Alphaproteobacteria bacterium]
MTQISSHKKSLLKTLLLFVMLFSAFCFTAVDDAAAQATETGVSSIEDSVTALSGSGIWKYAGEGAMHKLIGGAFHQVLGSMLGGADKVYANIGFNCWSCELLTVAFFFNEILGVKAFLMVKDTSANLLKAMLSLWLVLEVAKILLPFGPMGQAQGIFNDIFVKLSWGVIAFALLTTGSEIKSNDATVTGINGYGMPSTFGELTFTYYTVLPVMRAALLWGNEILEVSENLYKGLQAGNVKGNSIGVLSNTTDHANDVNWNSQGNSVYNTFTYRNDTKDAAMRAGTTISEAASTGGTTTISDATWCHAPVSTAAEIKSSSDLSASLYAGLICRIARIQQELGLPLVLALFNILQPGERQAIWENALYGIFNGMFLSTLSQLVAGLMLFAIYGMAIFTYPFNIMEGIFRITIGTIVAPIAIALGVFKPFRGPLKMVFTMIIHGSISILFASIAVAIGMNLVRTSLSMITGMYNATLSKAIDLSDHSADKTNLMTRYKVTNLATFLAAVDGTLMKSNLFSTYDEDGNINGATGGMAANAQTELMASKSENEQTVIADGIAESEAMKLKYQHIQNLEGALGARGHLMIRVEVHSSPFWILFFASALLNFLIKAADKMAGQLTENQFGTGAASGVAGMGQSFIQSGTMASANAGRQWWNMGHMAFGQKK